MVFNQNHKPKSSLNVITSAHKVLEDCEGPAGVLSPDSRAEPGVLGGKSAFSFLTSNKIRSDLFHSYLPQSLNFISIRNFNGENTYIHK